jgi:hypothetical protein
MFSSFFFPTHKQPYNRAGGTRELVERCLNGFFLSFKTSKYAFNNIRILIYLPA